MQLSEIEVAVEPPPAAATAEPEATPVPADAPRVESKPSSASASAAMAPAPIPSPASAAPDSEPVGPVVSTLPGEPAEGTWTFSPTKGGAGAAGHAAAIDGTSALGHATSAGVGVVLAEAQRKARDRERKPLVFTPQDFALGLAPGGQFVAIAKDRVRNSVVPNESHALLEFWTDKGGLVARVRVLEASSDPSAWSEVAQALAEDAHATYPLKIPSNADGLIVTLDVTSTMRTLSGASPNQGALAKAFEAARNPVDAVLDSKAPTLRMVAAKVVRVEAF